MDTLTNEFNNTFRDILSIYQSSSNNFFKWNRVAEIIHSNQSTFTKLFKMLKKETLKDLDYELELDALLNKINEEKHMMDRIRWLLVGYHIIVYDLASQEGNYLFSLNGQDEMIILKKPITYYITICSKKEQNILFNAFLLIYSLESLFHKNFYVGVDFEYTYRVIKLMQINFEHKIDLKSFIMIVSPHDVGETINKVIINQLMCNNHMKKLLMGADSLDYPYIRDEMLNKNPSKIIKFTNSMVDVRYPCEYYKAVKQVNLNYSKCSIYDAVVYFGVISQEKRDQLTLMEETMPVPVDRDWTINKLSLSQQKYVQYDVLFLKYYYFRMIYVATQDVTSESDKKDIIDLYKHIMYELTQFIYLEKSAITLLTAKCKEEVDIMNIYMVRRPNNVYKMQDIMKHVSYNIITKNPYADIDKLSTVKMYATTLTLLIKKLTYTLVSQKYTIHKSKIDIFKISLSNDYLFDFFETMGYPFLKRMFKEIETILKGRIQKLLH